MTIDLLCRGAALSIVAWMLFYMFVPARKPVPVRSKTSAAERSERDGAR